MKPAAFRYHAPTSVDDVVALLAGLDDAKVISGGQSLVPLLNMRLAMVSDLVDLRRVAEIRGIERRDGALWIGAATTQAAVEHSREVAADVPLLAKAVPLIGHFQIRNRGTIGGSLAHADPASELPAVALALDAEFEATSPQGERTIPAAEFFDGIWSTALADDELLTGVRFPIWAGRCGFAVEEFTRRHGDFAVAGACVAIELDVSESTGDPTIRRCAITLFGMGSTPERAHGAEQSVVGRPGEAVDASVLGRLAVAGLANVPSDQNGTKDYRVRVGAIVVERAWRRALEDALDG